MARPGRSVRENSATGPETCQEWNQVDARGQVTGTGTSCTRSGTSGTKPSLNAAAKIVVFRSWSRPLTVPFYPDDWLLPVVRNGLIAAGVAYLLLILIVVPARMLKRPD